MKNLKSKNINTVHEDYGHNIYKECSVRLISYAFILLNRFIFFSCWSSMINEKVIMWKQLDVTVSDCGEAGCAPHR